MNVCKDFLFDLDDPCVVERARKNREKQIITAKGRKISERDIKKEIIERRKNEETKDENGAWEFNETALVLLAEIPIGRNRKLKKWCQANFNIETLKSFFGTEPNQKYEVVLRCITNEGLMLDIEKRPVISKKSTNYCFELTPPKDTLYPEDGRPIVVFIKLAVRTFLYMIIMPNDLYHEQLSSKLDQNRIRADRMARHQLLVKDLMKICRELPILDYVEE